MSYRFGLRQKSKFSNRRTTLAGRSFQSNGEANCYLWLEHLQTLGEITELQTQVSCHLTLARILYIADFKFFDCKTGEWVYGDFKGFETDVWRIKRRLWKYYGLGPLRVYKGTKGGITLTEEIRPVEIDTPVI